MKKLLSIGEAAILLLAISAWIRFRVMNSSSGPVLAVDASIENDFYGNFLGLGNSFYASMADRNWQSFAMNLDKVVLA